MIYVPRTLNNLVINTPQLYLLHQKSSSYSQNTPRDNQCFNSEDSNSKRNELPSPVIPVTPPLNYLVINLPQLYSVHQTSSISSHNTTHELQDSSIPGQTSPDPSNTMPPPSTKNGSRNIYGCIVDVSKLKPVQRKQHAVMLLHNYHKLCNMNDP